MSLSFVRIELVGHRVAVAKIWGQIFIAAFGNNNGLDEVSTGSRGPFNHAEPIGKAGWRRSLLTVTSLTTTSDRGHLSHCHCIWGE